MKTLRLVYDFTSQPFSVGDILTFHEMSLILCEAGGYEAIDFVFTYDPLNPVQRVRDYAHITPQNFIDHLPALEGLGWANSKVRSVKTVTHQQLLDLPECDSWPQEIPDVYLFYEIAREVNRFYRERGYVPNLSCRDVELAWAREFGGDYISVQLRKNEVNPKRNSNFDAWAEFLPTRKERFVIIGKAEEIDARLRAPNVKLAKDYGTTALDDVALVQASRIHMGADSGPGVMATYSRKPYRMFNSQGPVLAESWISESGWGWFPFSTSKQAVLQCVETPEILERELEAML